MLRARRRGGEERLTFSVLWEMSAEAEVLGTTFTRAIIRSRAALTYAEAQVGSSRGGGSPAQHAWMGWTGLG